MIIANAIIAVKERFPGNYTTMPAHRMRQVVYNTRVKYTATREGKMPAILMMVLLVAVAPAAAEVLPGVSTGLTAYYDFNALATDTASVRDRSGNGFDLTPVGSVIATDGVYGTAARFAGTYLQGEGNPLAGAEQYSISLWFKTAQPANNYKLAAAAWWRGGTNASGWNIGTHYAEAWADGRQGSLRDDSGWNRREQFRADEWNHLVVVYDGVTFSEYVNGELSLRVPGTGLAVGSGADLQVGHWLGFRYDGAIDELRFYRRVLRAEEIRLLHRAASGLP